MINSLLVLAGQLQVPNGDPKAPGDFGARANTLISYAKFGGLALCVVAMIVAGGSLAISHNRGHGSNEGIMRVAFVMLAVGVISGAAGLVGAAL